MGVSLLLRMAFACKAKANLHPLAFTQPNLRHLSCSAWLVEHPNRVNFRRTLNPGEHCPFSFCRPTDVLRGRIVLLAANGGTMKRFRPCWAYPNQWSSSGGAVLPALGSLVLATGPGGDGSGNMMPPYGAASPRRRAAHRRILSVRTGFSPIGRAKGRVPTIPSLNPGCWSFSDSI